MQIAKLLGTAAAALALAGPILSSPGAAAAPEKELVFETNHGELTFYVSTEYSPYGQLGSVSNEKFGFFNAWIDRFGTITAKWDARSIVDPPGPRCESNGILSRYWGRAVWRVEGEQLTGFLSYCDEPSGSRGVWNGRLVSGNPVILQHKARRGPRDADDGEDLERALQLWSGRAGETLAPQLLRADFNCDGNRDGAAGRVNIDRDGQASFDVLVYTYVQGDFLAETLALPLAEPGAPSEARGPKGQCLLSRDPAPPITAEENLLSLATIKGLYGAHHSCQMAIRVTDENCGETWVYWSNRLFWDTDTVPFGSSHLAIAP